jgi:hypothetical protein
MTIVMGPSPARNSRSKTNKPQPRTRPSAGIVPNDDIGDHLVLVAALGIDADGKKHPLGSMEGATENAAVAQALIDNLIDRGLDPTACRLFMSTTPRR